MTRALLAAAAALLPSAAQAQSLPAGALPCLELSRVTGPEITRDGTILYHQNRRRSWRAETIGACPGLNRDTRLAVFPFQGQRLCRGDKLQAFYPQSSVPGAICRFAGFVPVDQAAAR